MLPTVPIPAFGQVGGGGIEISRGRTEYERADATEDRVGSEKQFGPHM